MSDATCSPAWSSLCGSHDVERLQYSDEAAWEDDDSVSVPVFWRRGLRVSFLSTFAMLGALRQLAPTPPLTKTFGVPQCWCSKRDEHGAVAIASVTGVATTSPMDKSGDAGRRG